MAMEDPKFFMLDEGTEDFYNFPDDWAEEDEEDPIEEDVDLKKIIVVDASPFHRNILKGHLESAGYKVVAVGGAAEDVRKSLEDPKIRLAAVDIDQTNGGGAKAIQLIAAEFPKTIFVITSARISAEQVSRSAMRDHYFLSKPFQKEVVQAEMKRVYETEIKKKKSSIPAKAQPERPGGAG